MKKIKTIRYKLTDKEIKTLKMFPIRMLSDNLGISYSFVSEILNRKRPLPMKRVYGFKQMIKFARRFFK